MPKKDKRSVAVTCTSTDLIDPKRLTPFQGDLKWLEDKQYAKLKESLLRHGFSFPVYAWKNSRKNYVIDAHQRLLALGKMREEGIVLEGGKVPVVWVMAENEKQAKELVLAAMSQYGRYDEDSVYKYINESNLEWAESKDVLDFPSFNMGTFEVGWFGDPAEGDDTVVAKSEDLDDDYKCPKCGFQWVGKKKAEGSKDDAFK